MQNTSRRIVASAVLLAMAGVVPVASARAQSVLFDFNNAPLHSSLPIDQTAGGITAHFAGTGQGFSIQDASSPVVPVGFSGRFIYPNSIFSADLLISFDQPVSSFSILYSPQELACDDSATMRVTASMNGNFVGTNTKTASHPGTWPVDTLGCTFAQGFNSVVVHYDSHPPTCMDYGTIFLADDMRVTPLGNAISAFCFGDGSGTPCPCGNSGSAGHGCANSIFASGAGLSATGIPSVGADSLVLHGSGMLDASALYFQGTVQAAGGAGSPFGDGLRCAGGTEVRLGTKLNLGGASSYPGAGEPSISQKGAIAPSGGTRTYQVWYRNAGPFCTSSTFNLSNGVQVVWQP